MRIRIRHHRLTVVLAIVIVGMVEVATVARCARSLPKYAIVEDQVLANHQIRNQYIITLIAIDDRPVTKHILKPWEDDAPVAVVLPGTHRFRVSLIPITSSQRRPVITNFSAAVKAGMVYVVAYQKQHLSLIPNNGR